MKRTRRQYSADWKAKIALEAIKGQQTIQQIASHYEIHPDLMTHWKKQWLEGAAQIFSNGQKAGRERPWNFGLKGWMVSREGIEPPTY